MFGQVQCCNLPPPCPARPSSFDAVFIMYTPRGTSVSCWVQHSLSSTAQHGMRALPVSVTLRGGDAGFCNDSFWGTAMAVAFVLAAGPSLGPRLVFTYLAGDCDRLTDRLTSGQDDFCVAISQLTIMTDQWTRNQPLSKPDPSSGGAVAHGITWAACKLDT